jgi:hypothetical protein
MSIKYNQYFYSLLLIILSILVLIMYILEKQPIYTNTKYKILQINSPLYFIHIVILCNYSSKSGEGDPNARR